MCLMCLQSTVATQTGHLIAPVQDLVVEECNGEGDIATNQYQLTGERTVRGRVQAFPVDCATLSNAHQVPFMAQNVVP